MNQVCPNSWNDLIRSIVPSKLALLWETVMKSIW